MLKRSRRASWCSRLLIVVALASGATHLVAARPVTPAPADLLVCVVDGGGEPIVGASILFVGTLYGGVSDATGCFRFSGVASGTYVLRVQRDEFDALERPIVVDASISSVVEVRLHRRIVRIADRSGLLDHFDVALLLDGYVVAGVQRRTGSFAERSRFVVTPLSERLSGALDPRSVLRPFDEAARAGAGQNEYAVPPYIEAAATSNTESLFLESGVGVSTDGRGFRARAMTAGGAAYRDGAGSLVESAYRANRLDVAAFRESARSRLEFGGEAALATKSTRPASGPDVDRAVQLAGRLDFDRRLDNDRTTVGLRVAGGWIDDSWVSPSFLRSLVYGMDGSHRRFHVGGSAEIEHSVGSQLRATATFRVRLDNQAQRKRISSVPESATLVLPEIRDLSVGFNTGLSYATASLTVSGAVGLQFVGSIVRPAASTSKTDTALFPQGKFSIKFAGRGVLLEYSAIHAQWLPTYEERTGVVADFWLGQSIAGAWPFPTPTRARSTVQRVGVEVPRGSFLFAAKYSFEFLHDIASPVAARTEEMVSTLESERGRSWTLSAGVSWEPLGLLKAGIVTHILRGHNVTHDEPLASVPSSVVGGFVEIAPLGPYPFLRWTSMQRIARRRSAGYLMEVATPGSITSDVEAGVRIGDVAIALGILNVGDRIVRDHVFSQPSTGDLVNYPGRRWRATLRIRAPR